MSQRANLGRLREAAPVILPSLLLCDFGHLEQEVRRLEAAGVQALHLDVMDGCLVPNITYGMPIVAALRRITSLPLDVHLMIVDPEKYVEAFFEAGADVMTVHIEAFPEDGDPRPLLRRIRDLGAGAGIALDPGTPLSRVEGCLDLCDLVLTMSVPAGFGKQAFEAGVLDKVRRLRTLVGPEVMLEIDGGINASTTRRCAEAGVEYFVVGSAIFGRPAEDYGSVIRDLQALANVS